MTILPIAAALLLGAMSARAQGNKPVLVYLPERDWALSLTAPGFVLEGLDVSPGQDRASIRAAGGPGLERFGLSAYVEVIPDAEDAAGCRAFYGARHDAWEKKSRGEMVMTKRKLSTKGKQARSEHFIESYRGQRMHQKHVNAYLRKDGACIDVHISALEHRPADDKVFEKVLMSLRWAAPGEGKPAWMTAFVTAASRAERRDREGAVAAYLEARAGAAKDPKATETDLAMLDKGLGENYLAMDDARNAHPALSAAARVLKDDPSVFYNLACASSMLGRMAEAKRSLEACYSEASKRGRLRRYLDQTVRDPQLAAFRASPEFKALADDPQLR
jgi:tetratricopeptide (TPR) repeat protein